MWSESNEYISPSEIKKAITKSSKTFVGYSQQDSQEFLSFFMDILMDELNEKMVKPYIEVKDYKKQSYEDYANYIWDILLSRNKSKIIDLFYGQYFQEVTCPDCNYKSISCDPFDIVPLNIPLDKSGKIFKLYIVFQNYSQGILHVNIKVNTSESLKKTFA